MPGRRWKKISHGVLPVNNAVIDTGPLIHLHEIDQLEIITAVFSNLHIPEYVKREIRNEPILKFIALHSDRIKVHPVSEPELFPVKDAYSKFQLHLADLAVVTVLLKISDSLALTDDLALRRAIESNGRTVVGTVGILFKAYKRGVIDKPRLIELIDRIFNDSSLYLSSSFRMRVLSIAESLL